MENRAEKYSMATAPAPGDANSESLDAARTELRDAVPEAAETIRELLDAEDERVRLRAAGVAGDVPVLVPTIVLHELYTGAIRSGGGESITDIRRELAGTRFVGFNDAAAEEAAAIRATLAGRGNTINALDTLIAGVAREANAEMVAVDRDYGGVLRSRCSRSARRGRPERPGRSMIDETY